MVVTSGLNSTTKVQQSYPSCTVTVYATGTTNLSTIYSDNSSTPLANPFTSSSTGLWFFYAANARYDVKLSGGGIASPFTVADILLADPSSAGGAVNSFNGRTGTVLPATGDYTLRQISNVPWLSTSDYNFTAQQPGGTLTATVGATITLTPCPLGVAGTHTVAGNLPHLLYISGGTGTAEAPAITGGTCTSGATTGTITLTPANSHSGAWTIQSNTTGAQECIYVAGATGACRMPAGHVDLWANTSTVAALTVPDGYSTSLRGSGEGPTAMLTHGTTGNWLVFDYVSSGGFIDTGDFLLVDSSGTNGAAVAHTSGKMMYVRRRSDGNVQRIYMNNCYDCLVVEANARTEYSAITIGTYHYGLQLTCSGEHIATCQNTGQYTDILISSAVAGTDGLRIESPTAGVQFNNFGTGAASNTSNNAVHLVSLDGAHCGGSVDPLNEIVFSNPIIDGHAVGVRYTGNGTCYTSNQISFVGGRVNSANVAVYAELFADNLSFTGTRLISAGGGGIGIDRAIVLAGDVRNASFVDSPLIATDGDACLLETGVASKVTFSGNVCGDTVGGIRPNYAFTVQGTITGWDVMNNNLTNVITGMLNNSGALAAPIVWRNNTGIDNVIPAVASSATLAFPLNPIFTITGSTPPTAVTFPLGAGSVGARGMLTATDASLLFTTGASIGNTFIARLNVPASWYWDGTKIWLSGQDPGLSNTYNYIATEGGANNAITGTLTGVSLAAGLRVTVQLAHTLQAGANTFALNGGSAVAIKSSRNVANNIATAYAATGTITLLYDGTRWVDVSQ